MIKKIYLSTKPIELLLTVLTYGLGAGIAHYLGHPFRAAGFSLGLIVVLSIQVASQFLVVYFRLPLTPRAQDETMREREQFRVTLLQVIFASMAFAAVVIISLLITHQLNLLSGSTLLIITISLLVYAIPPIRLSETGYGELLQAILFGTVIPALAFLSQVNELHRILPIIALPLSILGIAYLLACDFPSFANDQKYGRRTLLTRLTWQRAVPIHHFLIMIAFILFSTAPLLGIPWRLVWPVFLVLPFAIVQIIWLQRIANGGRTIWQFFTTTSVVTFGLTVYFLALTFWMR